MCHLKKNLTKKAQATASLEAVVLAIKEVVLRQMIESAIKKKRRTRAPQVHNIGTTREGARQKLRAQRCPVPCGIDPIPPVAVLSAQKLRQDHRGGSGPELFYTAQRKISYTFVLNYA